jgi:hypothetical protein
MLSQKKDITNCFIGQLWMLDVAKLMANVVFLNMLGIGSVFLSNGNVTQSAVGPKRCVGEHAIVGTMGGKNDSRRGDRQRKRGSRWATTWIGGLGRRIKLKPHRVRGDLHVADFETSLQTRANKETRLPMPAWKTSFTSLTLTDRIRRMVGKRDSWRH